MESSSLRALAVNKTDCHVMQPPTYELLRICCIFETVNVSNRTREKFYSKYTTHKECYWRVHTVNAISCQIPMTIHQKHSCCLEGPIFMDPPLAP